MDDAYLQACVNYYCRNKLWHQLFVLCQEQMAKKGNDPVIVFWKAFSKFQYVKSICMEGNISQAIRDLDVLKNKPDISLAATSCMIYAHSKAKLVDNEAVNNLTKQLKNDENSTSDRGCLNMALFSWHTNNVEQAKKYLQRASEMNGKLIGLNSAMGWVDLLSERESLSMKSVAFFDTVLNSSGNKKDLESLLGKAKWCEKQGKLNDACDLLTQTIVLFDKFIPALTEKAKIFLKQQDWDQTMEMAQRTILQDPSNIEGLKLICLYLLARDSRSVVIVNRITDLLQAIDKIEPKNSKLYYDVSRPLARLAGRNSTILAITMNLIERAIALQPDNSEYVTELGYQKSLLGDVKGAVNNYRQAMKLDESNVTALNGMIKCQILEGSYDDAQQQLEFLNEIHQSIGKSPELVFLSALLVSRKSANAAKSSQLLDDTLDMHLRLLANSLVTYEYFTEYNPDFLMEIAKEYLLYIGTEPLEQSDILPPGLNKAKKILSALSKTVSGLLESHYLLAKIQYISGHFDVAQQTLQQCLRLDPTLAVAHLLLAQIHLACGRIKPAQNSLELALNRSFDVKSTLPYNLVHAKILEKLGNLEDALKVLISSVEIPGVKSVSSNNNNNKAFSLAASNSKGNLSNNNNVGGISLPMMKSSIHDMNSALSLSISTAPALSDVVSLYLQLAEVHSKMNHFMEATKVIQEATANFASTSEEARVFIANANLSVAKGDVEGAINMLKNISPENSNYLKARIQLANIYYTNRNDKRMYVRTLRELSEKIPTSATAFRLGDAYMKVQEPEQAIEIYQQALKKSPNDASLASKIGHALINTHDYNRAIEYYETAVKSDPSNSVLCYDLASLYMKLKKSNEALSTISRFMEALEKNGGNNNNSLSSNNNNKSNNDLKKDDGNNKNGASTVSVLTSKVNFTLLKAKIYNGMEEYENCSVTLLLAKDFQLQLLERVKVEQPDTVRDQRKELANIHFTIAEHYKKLRQFDNAIAFYNETLKQNESHEKSLIELAQLYMQRDEMDLSQNQCSTLLRMDSTNEEATMMLANIQFRKNEYESAAFHFQKLLSRNPTHYTALVRWIELMRRIGKLNEVPKIFQSAETNRPSVQFDPGFLYCKGLYSRYSNNPRQALKEFNVARKDAEWCENAIYQMVEIYLNPDNENLWEDSATDNSESIKAGEKLLSELKARPKTLKHQILESYALMASKNKANVDKALATLLKIMESERENVSALLALSTAFMMKKESQKAKNQLKRITKLPYNPIEADDFERANLMLAYLYIEAGKYDFAQELLKKVSKENQSCSKAAEYLGTVYEKEQSYKDAAIEYQKAWKYEFEASASIGYKLAFNYLKAKRYVEAIEICHKVLALYPNYPKIKKEILFKARLALKT